jgi:hypothetical protein
VVRIMHHSLHLSEDRGQRATHPKEPHQNHQQKTCDSAHTNLSHRANDDSKKPGAAGTRHGASHPTKALLS